MRQERWVVVEGLLRRPRVAEDAFRVRDTAIEDLGPIARGAFCGCHQIPEPHPASKDEAVIPVPAVYFLCHQDQNPAVSVDIGEAAVVLVMHDLRVGVVEGVQFRQL